MSTQDPLYPSASTSQDDASTSGNSGTTILPTEAEQKVKSDLSAVASTARENLETIKQEAKGQVDTLKQQAQEQVETLRQQAQEQIGAVTERAKSFAAEQKDFAAGQLGGIATALTRVADEMSTEQSAVAGYARDMARGLQNFSDTVKNRNVEDIVGIAEDFGRRQPAAFLGAAALLGFVASRFLLSSSQRRSTQSGMGTGYQSGTDYQSGAGYSTGTGTYAGDQSTNYQPGTSPAYGSDETSTGTSTGSSYGSQYGQRSGNASNGTTPFGSTGGNI